MPIRLDSNTEDFASRFTAFLATKREGAADVEEVARTIIAEVAARGDEALAAYTRKFDRIDVGASGLRVAPAEIDDAFASCGVGPRLLLSASMCRAVPRPIRPRC